MFQVEHVAEMDAREKLHLPDGSVQNLNYCEYPYPIITEELDVCD